MSPYPHKPRRSCRHTAHRGVGALRLLLLLILSVQFCWYGTDNNVSAQADEAPGPAATNLSLSGAASDPVVVTQPDGTLRVFWWDQFDGVTMVEGSVDAWSDPVATPIILVEALERPTAQGDTVIRTPIAQMPVIVGDSSGSTHALWLGEADEETGGHPLLYANLGATSTTWSTPRSIADSATCFHLLGDAEDALHLIYVRDLDTASSPAGLYYRQSTNGGANWTAAVIVDASRYYRLLTPETADLDVAVEQSGAIHATWHDPNLGRVMLSSSSDDGETWEEPVAVGQPDGGSGRGRLVTVAGAADDQSWLLWQDNAFGTGCALMQAAVEDLLAGEEEGEAVLADLTSCPEPGASWFLPMGDDQTLLVVGSEAGSTTVALWDGQQWSEPRGLRFDFEDPVRETPVYMPASQAVLVQPPSEEEEAEPTEPGEQLMAFVGTDERGDVWVVPLGLDALELVFAPPSPWSAPAAISESAAAPGVPAVVADAEGRVHVLWAEPESGDGTTTVLWYARWDQARWSRPAVVLRSPEGGAKQPVLALSGEYLHALWSGGTSGSIWYSRAFVRDAYSAGGWLEPTLLAETEASAPPEVGSNPDLVAAAGQLYAVHAVPVNEDRCIIFTSSADGGETWRPPVVVFDAAAAGWTTVDVPRLAVDAQGGLHVVWLRPALSPDEPSQGVSYAWSRDGGDTWSEPLTVAEGAYAWPQVAAAGQDQVHLLWQDVARGGAWWHRWLVDAPAWQSSAEAWAGWSRSEQVVGLRDVDGPIAILPDGEGQLHLVGMRASDAAPAAIVHLLWDGEGWEQQEGLDLASGTGDALTSATMGAAAALQAEAGHLDVVFGAYVPVSEGTPQIELWHTGREVLPAEAYTVVLPEVPVTPTPRPTATTVPFLTPTPDLSGGPAPAGQSSALPFSTSLLMSGGLAAVIILVAFGARLLVLGRR